MIRSVVVFFIALLVASCASQTNRYVDVSENESLEFDLWFQEFEEESQANYQALMELTESVKNGDTEVNYQNFRQLYLQSKQVESFAEAYDLFDTQSLALDSGEIGCSDFEVEKIIQLNVFSYSALVTAVDCYIENQNDEKALAYRRLLEFILTGVLSHGTGEHYYDAFVIGPWREAEDIIALSGYELIDSYFEFVVSRNAMYRIYLVWDSENEAYKEIVFDNLQFLYRAMGAEYPYSSDENFIIDNIIGAIKEIDYAGTLAEASLLIEEGQYQQAESAMLKAIELGSSYANLELGKLCLMGESVQFKLEECPQLFVSAAELRIELAKVYLAYMAYLGVGMEIDSQLADELISSVSGLEKGKAELEMAKLLLTEHFGPVNQAGAKRFVKLAQDAGNSHAFLLGMLLNSENAPALLEQAAKAGSSVAVYELARQELLDNRQATSGIDDLLALANQQYPDALFLLGNVYEFGVSGVQKDLKRAFKYYQQAALKWHLQAQYRLGLFYSNENNLGIETNYTKANSWYFLCARLGNLDCITNLAFMYEKGLGVEKNEVLAVELYKSAADEQLPRAIFNLGKMKEEGRGVAKDLFEALLLFEQAAGLGDIWAANASGLYYLNGRVVEQDYFIALDYFQQSAQGGYLFGHYNLARMHHFGWGTPRDESTALHHYGMASDLGHGQSSLEFAKLLLETEGESDETIGRAVHYLRLAQQRGVYEARAMIQKLCKNKSCEAPQPNRNIEIRRE